MSSALPSGIPSAMSNRTMSPSSRIAAKWASVPPIIPAPISAILRRAMKPVLSSAWSGPRRDRRSDVRASRPAEEAGQPGLGLFGLALEQAEDVAVGILEPGRLHALGDIEVAALLEPRHVILLEENALVLEVADFGFDVIDRERQSGRLVGPGMLRAIDVDHRLAALHLEHLAAHRFLCLEAERVLVEFARPIDVLDRDHRHRFRLGEHRLSPCWPRSTNG